MPKRPSTTAFTQKPTSTRAVAYKGRAFIEEYNKVDRSQVRARAFRTTVEIYVVSISSARCFHHLLLTRPRLPQLTPLPGSHITCYKNGECMGKMFENLYDGIYYPAVSLYYGGKV